MKWGIENNIDAAVRNGRLKLVEGGLVVPTDFSLEYYAQGPLEYFKTNHAPIRVHQTKNDGTKFPGFDENLGRMKIARDKCHATLTDYWGRVIDKVLEEGDWDIMTKYEGADLRYKSEQLKRERGNPEWDSDLYLVKPGRLAIVTRSAVNRSELLLVFTPDETADNARIRYCEKLGDFYNLSLPQIAVYSADDDLLNRVHKASKEVSIKVLDWTVPSPLWSK